ncbi:MAG: hypothetical protein JSV19_09295 [Phycisphaerales bacterium]|nr:MAG: hypothetical protein JSV19_09295 [Phycisphaerales bacterium]
MDNANRQTSQTEETSDDALFCPECGYNLRAIPERRCPECGYGFDRVGVRDLAEQYVEAELAAFRRVTLCALAAIGLVGLGLLRQGVACGLVLVVAMGVAFGASVRYGIRDVPALFWLVLVLGIVPVPLLAGTPLWLWLASPLPLVGIYLLARTARIPEFASMSASADLQKQRRFAFAAAYISLAASVFAVCARWLQLY